MGLNLQNLGQQLGLGQQGLDQLGLGQEGAEGLDPSKMDTKQLMKLIKQLMEQLQAAQEQGKQCGGGQSGGAPQGGAPQGGAPAGGAESAGGGLMSMLEQLLEELQKRKKENPQGVEQAAGQVPGGQSVLAAADTASAAASSPGIPAGFA